MTKTQVMQFDAYGALEIYEEFDYFVEAETFYIELIKDRDPLGCRDFMSKLNEITQEQMTIFDDGTIIRLINGVR